MALFVVQFLQSSLLSKEVDDLSSVQSSSDSISRVGEVYLLQNSDGSIQHLHLSMYA